MDDSSLNIFLVGLGGQGVLTASEILARLFVEHDFNVKKSEIHGLAQRGAPVFCGLRSKKGVIYSPVIPEKKGDILIAFDEHERENYRSFLNSSGIIFELTKEELTQLPSHKMMNVALIAKCVFYLSQCKKHYSFLKDGNSVWQNIKNIFPPKHQNTNQQVFIDFFK